MKSTNPRISATSFLIEHLVAQTKASLTVRLCKPGTATGILAPLFDGAIQYDPAQSRYQFRTKGTSGGTRGSGIRRMREVMQRAVPKIDGLRS